MLELLLNWIPADCDGQRARSRMLDEVRLLMLAELPLAALECSCEDILGVLEVSSSFIWRNLLGLLFVGVFVDPEWSPDVVPGVRLVRLWPRGLPDWPPWPELCPLPRPLLLPLMRPWPRPLPRPLMSLDMSVWIDPCPNLHMLTQITIVKVWS